MSLLEHIVIPTLVRELTLNLVRGSESLNCVVFYLKSVCAVVFVQSSPMIRQRNEPQNPNILWKDTS